VKRTAVVSVILIVSATAAGAAHADGDGTKRMCAAEHERTQRLRLDGRLRDARVAAIACRRQECPGLVRAACADLVDELEAALPGVQVEVRDEAGTTVTGVRIEVDGAAAERLDDGSILLEPGEHVLRVVTREGTTVSRPLVVGRGALRTNVSVQLPSATITAPARAPEMVAPPHASLHLWPELALGGASLVGLGVFTVFGLRGYREEVSLESSCAPRCAPGSDSAMRRDYLVADVALAAALVSLAGAICVYVARVSVVPRQAAGIRR
jgi:hypothetical protein